MPNSPMTPEQWLSQRPGDIDKVARRVLLANRRGSPEDGPILKAVRDIEARVFEEGRNGLSAGALEALYRRMAEIEREDRQGRESEQYTLSTGGVTCK